jgi:hypothetical protein
MIKKLAVVLLLTGCASVSDEEAAIILLDRYGPRCNAMGFTLEKSPEEMGRCIRSLALADRHKQSAQNLGYGLQGAGEILAPIPIRRRDFNCWAGCTRRYGAAYCEQVCSY